MSAHLESLLGSQQHVLVEGPSKTEPQNLSGRSGRFEIVHISDVEGLELIGELVEVEIVQAFKHSLLGRLGADERGRERSSKTRRSLPLIAKGTG